VNGNKEDRMRYTIGILAAALMVAVPPAARAQLGIKGGFSYGNVSNRGVLPGNLDTRTGFAAGLSLNSGTGLLGFGVEGLYAQRGVTSTTTGDSRKLDYIDVPAYLRVSLPTPGMSPFAFAGPQVSFELHCGANGGACPSGRPKTSTAAIIGAGLRFGAQSAFTVEGRYLYGLTDLKLSTVTSSSSYKTRSFLILAGFSF
jgi:outer membrane protein with beta-barrel domain